MRKLIQKYKYFQTRARSTPSHLKKIRALYVRYADDWGRGRFTNIDKESVEEFQLEIASFLESDLGLTLSKEKTMLTDLSKNYAKFLGFRFKNNQKHAPIISYQKKVNRSGRGAPENIYC